MSFNSEFQLHKFGFGDEDMKQIYLLEEWVIPLAFRFAAAVYFIIGIVLSIVNFPTPKWLLYLSYWNEILFTSYFIVGAILTAYLVSKRNESNKTNIPSYGAIALENENPRQYKSILATTFTNKAASEMKERVVEALKALSGKVLLEGTPKFLLADLIQPKVNFITYMIFFY